jgi:hypothetical protein
LDVAVIEQAAAGLPSEPKTRPTPEEAVLWAVAKLHAAGMVTRYVTRFGRSHYLGWPGRRGTLRVSDHTTDKREDAGIYARVTFSHKSNQGEREDWDVMETMVAAALGRFLMKAPRDE